MGECIQGSLVKRNLPIYKNLQEALANHQQIDYAIIGVATHGGVIPTEMEAELLLFIREQNLASSSISSE